LEKLIVLRSDRSIFAVDDPQTASDTVAVASPFSIHGWIIPLNGAQLVALKVFLNEQHRASATVGLRRNDVRLAFPDIQGARWSGFAVEVFADDLLDQTVTVRLRACYYDSTEEDLFGFTARIGQRSRVVPARERSWSLLSLVVCPHCFGELDETVSELRCKVCGASSQKRRGVPIFAAAGEVVQSKLLETNPTNPNHISHDRIIESAARGVVLDYGAGNPRLADHHPNVVLHEFVHYTHTDVVALTRVLPYRTNTFDAIISKAVFEHIPRPWEAAVELHRVLKPGGVIHIDTAFMQPLHGDPYHYFNMTLEAVREIFKHFRHVRSGIKPYQMPSFGLLMQIDVLLDHLESEQWVRRLRELRELIPRGLDASLDEAGRKRLAAGFFFEGIKD
jgi:SAM-dependent methyltransferase